MGEEFRKPPIGLVEFFQSECKEEEDGSFATETDYFHYTCMREGDDGWGCAYRSLQMILSNLLLRKEKEKKEGKNDSVCPDSFRHTLELEDLSSCVRSVETKRWEGMPSVLEIQERMAKIGWLKPEHVGTTEWIEPPHGCAFLNSWGIDAENFIFHANEPEARLPFELKLREHFSTHQTPVMIDDTIKAYCILGVKNDSSPSSSSSSSSPSQSSPSSSSSSSSSSSTPSPRVTHVLRFDPHAVEYPTNREPCGEKGAEWMPFELAFPPQAKQLKWLVLFPTRNPFTKEMKKPDLPEFDKNEIMKALQRCGIDPQSVLSIKQEPLSSCGWCKGPCGHSVILSPCSHAFCGSCADSLVDQQISLCPVCQQQIIDFQWDV